MKLRLLFLLAFSLITSSANSMWRPESTLPKGMSEEALAQGLIKQFADLSVDEKAFIAKYSLFFDINDGSNFDAAIKINPTIQWSKRGFEAIFSICMILELLKSQNNSNGFIFLEKLSGFANNQKIASKL